MEYTKYIKEAYANPFPNARTRIRAGELSCTAVFCVFVWSVCQDLHTYIERERDRNDSKRRELSSLR